MLLLDKLLFFVLVFQVIDLKTQLSYYKKVETWLRDKSGKNEAKTTLSRAVYLFSIGSNDYMSPFLTNSSVLNSYSKSEYVGIVIGNLTAVIKVSSTSILFSMTKNYIVKNLISIFTGCI